MSVLWTFLSLLGCIVAAFVVLIGVCVLQSRLLSEQEQADLADFMDEFLYGGPI